MNKRHYRKKSSWHFLYAFVFQSTKYFSTPEKRVIDTANGRFVFFLQRNTPHRICGKKKKRKHCQRKSYWHSLCSFSLFSSTKYSSTHMWKEEEEETLPEKELLTQLMFVLSRTRHGATQPSPTLMLWLPDFLHTTTQKNLEYQYHQIHFSMGMVIRYNVIHIWALETPLIQNDVFHFPKKLWYCNELRSLPSYITR